MPDATAGGLRCVLLLGATGRDTAALAQALAARLRPWVGAVRTAPPPGALASAAPATSLVPAPWALALDNGQYWLALAKATQCAQAARPGLPEAELPEALRHALHSATAVLLMGLDGPTEVTADDQRLDRLLRHWLQQARVAHQVLYGQTRQRLQQALQALAGPLGLPPEAVPPLAVSQAVWRCEACSDPDCEHRLFTALLRSRAAGRSPA